MGYDKLDCIRTVPKVMLHDGINILVCEIDSMWSVFPDQLHISGESWNVNYSGSSRW